MKRRRWQVVSLLAAAVIASLGAGSLLGKELTEDDPGPVERSQIKIVREIAGPPLGTTTLAVTADGKRAAVGSPDGSVRLIDLTAGTEIRLLQAHETSVTAAGFSPDGKHLATAAAEQVITWEVDSGAKRATTTLAANVAALGFLDNDLLLTAAGPELAVHARGKPDPVRRIQTPAEVTSLQLSADGKKIVTGHLDLTVRTWDLGTGKLQAEVSLGQVRKEPVEHQRFNNQVAIADHFELSVKTIYQIRYIYCGRSMALISATAGSRSKP